MDIARFITVAGLVAGCALMIPIAFGAIAELFATAGSRGLRYQARREPLRAAEPLDFPIRSSGGTATTGRPRRRIASLDDARAARSSRGAA